MRACRFVAAHAGSLGGRTSINAIPPWGGGESIADAILSPAGGFPDIWLAARDNTPDAYVATGLFGIAASAIVVGAGYLVASVVLGDQGIGAFLSKEKRDNPFYKDAIDQLKPNAPEFMNKIPLPDLDFVEVYNQSPRMKRDKAGAGGAGASSMIEDDQDSNSVMATAESLRQRLLEAVSPENPESLVCAQSWLPTAYDGVHWRATAATRRGPCCGYHRQARFGREGRLETATDAGEVIYLLGIGSDPETTTCWEKERRHLRLTNVHCMRYGSVPRFLSVQWVGRSVGRSGMTTEKDMRMVIPRALRNAVQVESKDYALASTLERELASFMRKNGMSFDDDARS